MTQVKIRPWKAKDIPAIYRIAEASFPLPWPLDELQRELQNEHALLLLAEEEGACLGFLQVWRVFDEAEIINIAVAPMHRKKGIANLLMKALMEALKERGVTDIYLEVRVSNTDARGLYEHYGFTVTGTRERYYIDGEDAFTMHLPLPAAP